MSTPGYNVDRSGYKWSYQWGPIAMISPLVGIVAIVPINPNYRPLHSQRSGRGAVTTYRAGTYSAANWPYAPLMHTYPATIDPGQWYPGRNRAR